MKVKLQQKPFEVLTLLLERPGELITRDEMRNRLWSGGTFVDFDQGIDRAIKKLREALGDSAEQPRFIETLPRRGYRFVFPVNGNGEPSQWAPPSTRVVLAPPPASLVEQTAALRARRVALGRRVPAVGAVLILVVVALFALNIAGLRSRLATLVVKHHPALCQGCHDDPNVGASGAERTSATKSK